MPELPLTHYSLSHVRSAQELLEVGLSHACLTTVENALSGYNRFEERADLQRPLRTGTPALCALIDTPDYYFNAESGLFQRTDSAYRGVTPDSFEQDVRALLPTLIKAGASFLTPNFDGKLAADLAFTTLAPPERVATCADIVLHTLKESKATGQLWQPDFEQQFREIAVEPENTGLYMQAREENAAQINRVGQAVANELRTPTTEIGHALQQILTPAEKATWTERDWHINPATMPASEFKLLEDTRAFSDMLAPLMKSEKPLPAPPSVPSSETKWLMSEAVEGPLLDMSIDEPGKFNDLVKRQANGTLTKAQKSELFLMGKQFLAVQDLPYTQMDKSNFTLVVYGLNKEKVPGLKGVEMKAGTAVRHALNALAKSSETPEQTSARSLKQIFNQLKLTRRLAPTAPAQGLSP